MNSTDQKRLANFYGQKLVVAAEQLRQRGVTLFPRGAEQDVDTWYVDFSENEPELIEIAPNEHARLLKEMWEAQGLPELASLAVAFVELGEGLDVEVEQTSDVSPSIYVMH